MSIPRTLINFKTLTIIIQILLKVLLKKFPYTARSTSGIASLKFFISFKTLAACSSALLKNIYIYMFIAGTWWLSSFHYATFSKAVPFLISQITQLCYILCSPCIILSAKNKVCKESISLHFLAPSHSVKSVTGILSELSKTLYILTQGDCSDSKIS